MLLTELGQPELESESCIPLQQGSMLLNGNLHLTEDLVHLLSALDVSQRSIPGVL